MLQWGNYRIPIDFELVRRKEDPAYQKPNVTFRQMLAALVPPAWAQQVIVVGDAGFPAKETLHLIQQRGFFFVMSLPRTWKLEDRPYAQSLGQSHALTPVIEKSGFVRTAPVGGSIGSTIAVVNACDTSEMSRWS